MTEAAGTTEDPGTKEAPGTPGTSSTTAPPAAASADTRSSAESGRFGALDTAADVLRCPVCGLPLSRVGTALRCRAGRHSFDIARDGHVSLLAGSRPISGDTADMVRARQRFLAAGHYEPLRRAVVDLAVEHLAEVARRAPDPAHAAEQPTVIDAGCGTGWYLSGVLDRDAQARAVGLDASPRALHAAVRDGDRDHPGRLAGVVCDLFVGIPVADAVADVVLSVFAPRNPLEFHRILRPDGLLVVARPTSDHLAELVGGLPGAVGVDPDKEQRLHDQLAPGFTPVTTRRVRAVLDLPPADAQDLVRMTPSARHVDAEELRTAALPDHVTVSVLVTAFRPR